jgi:CheY-like chemotaxis protein
LRLAAGGRFFLILAEGSVLAFPRSTGRFSFTNANIGAIFHLNKQRMSEKGVAMHILVAETDLSFLFEMQRALERAGHEVSVADNGMEAWDLLSGPEPPELLVTRFHLGEGQPPGTALGLRAYSGHPRIPVLYIPASTERAMHADPDHGAILVKPFAVAELIAAVDRLVGV